MFLFIGAHMNFSWERAKISYLKTCWPHQIYFTCNLQMKHQRRGKRSVLPPPLSICVLISIETKRSKNTITKSKHRLREKQFFVLFGYDRNRRVLHFECFAIHLNRICYKIENVYKTIIALTVSRKISTPTPTNRPLEA